MDISRRQFSQSMLYGLAGLTVGSLLKLERQLLASSEMKYRPWGTRTGLSLSEVGFGTASLTTPNLISFAHSLGINYIDTAHNYRNGAVEENIGRSMGKLRSKFILTTKWQPWSHTKKDQMMNELNTSLKRLKTDYVDCLMVHGVGGHKHHEGLERLHNDELYEAFELAKKQGKIRFTGVSGHDPDLMEVMNWVIDSGKYDAILMRYNFRQYKTQKDVIKKAKAKGMGVTVMKTLSGAKKQPEVMKLKKAGSTFKEAALKWTLSNPDITNLVISMNSRDQIQEYASVSGKPMTAADKTVLEKATAMLKPFSNDHFHHQKAHPQKHHHLGS